MGKKDDYRDALKPHFDSYLKNGESAHLKEILETNSNLPGRRANLEFADAFAELIDEFAETHGERLWELCGALVELSPEVAPVDDPKEFIPFCGTVAVGALGSSVDAFYEDTLTMLKKLSRDRRWRMREAVRMGLQKLLRKHPEKTFEALQNWIPEGDPLEMRAVAATVSNLELLLDQGFANRVLDLHKEILDQIGPIEARKTKSFRALRKALGYTLSIVICALPEAGFAVVDELIVSKDTDLIWIAKNNLKKRRVLRNFPEEAESRLQGL
jgi:hypothetical protein